MMHETRRALRPGWLLAAGLLVLGTTLAAAAGQDQPSQVQSAQPPAAAAGAEAALDDEKLFEVGEATTERVCTECHGVEDIFVVRRTSRGWQNVIIDMAGRGVPATKDQLNLVRRYLTRSFGLVSVNTATADELSAVLGLSAEQAAAVVEYRKAHGKFANLDALAKVPGLDRATLEPEADALQFE